MQQNINQYRLQLTKYFGDRVRVSAWACRGTFMFGMDSLELDKELHTGKDVRGPRSKCLNNQSQVNRRPCSWLLIYAGAAKRSSRSSGRLGQHNFCIMLLRSRLPRIVRSQAQAVLMLRVKTQGLNAEGTCSTRVSKQVSFTIDIAPHS